jgi:hypothetical protein
MFARDRLREMKARKSTFMKNHRENSPSVAGYLSEKSELDSSSIQN